MARSSNTFLAFAEHDLSRVTPQQLAQLSTRIESIRESELRDSDQGALAEQIIGEFTLNAPVFDFDNVKKTSSEQQVEDTSGMGAIIAASRGGSRQVTRQVITYHIPFTGNTDLLRCRPSTYSMSAPLVYVRGTFNGPELCFDVIRPSNNPNQVQQDLEQVRQEAERNMSQLRTASERLAQDLEGYNAQVRMDVPNHIAARIQRLQGNDDFLGQL